jgi:hypothetical protein
MACWVLAALLAGTMAGGDDDRLGQAAILITAASAIAGPVYLFAVIGRLLRTVPDPTLFNRVFDLSFLPLLLAPLLTLLYALLESHRRYRRAVTVGLPIVALAPLVLVLFLAPPWASVNRPPSTPEAPSPVLQVDPQYLYPNCAQLPVVGIISITNQGGGTLEWRFASSTDPAIMLFPTSGSLGSHAGETVRVQASRFSSPTVPNEVTIAIDSNGGNRNVTLLCASPG